MAKPKKPFGGENKKYVGERGSRDQWVADALKIFGLPISKEADMQTQPEDWVVVKFTKEEEEPSAKNKPDKTTKKVEKNDKIRKIKW